MSVYVDGCRNKFGRMMMCHMWADTLEELLEFSDALGMKREWLHAPPDCKWPHFDVPLGRKREALAAGAILTDRLGFIEFIALKQGKMRKVKKIRRYRDRKALIPIGNLQNGSE